MSEKNETVFDYLKRMAEKGERNGYGPWKTTREVADYMGWSLAKARRELDALYQVQTIHAYKEGREILWAVES